VPSLSAAWIGGAWLGDAGAFSSPAWIDEALGFVLARGPGLGLHQYAALSIMYTSSGLGARGSVCTNMQLFGTWFLDRPEIDDFWGLGGSGGWEIPSKRSGAKRPPFRKGFPGRRGRPDPPNRRWSIIIFGHHSQISGVDPPLDLGRLPTPRSAGLPPPDRGVRGRETSRVKRGVLGGGSPPGDHLLLPVFASL
jgi:hypothetical protein